MKKIMLAAMIALLGVSISVEPALAGSKQRHRWEGVAIGVGAAILGHALINSCNDRHYCEKVTVYHRPCPPPHRYGLWETRSVWVEPEYEWVWNPGHYTRHGRWVDGRWQMIEKYPGYWREDRVWVGCR